MKILLTGSNGFIGGSIAKRVQGYGTIIGLGRKPENKCPYVDRYVQVDLADPQAMETLAGEKVDAIIHAAANLDMSPETSGPIVDNTLGTYYLTRLAAKNGCRKFIYISSLPVVGTPRSAASTPITEKTCPEPETVYHISKLAGEHLVALLGREGMQATSLRIPSPIGKGMSEKTILSVFFEKACSGQVISIRGKGTRRQNYIDVRDIAEAVALCLEAEHLSGCYNIVSPFTISNKELALHCIQATRSVSPMIFEGEDLNDAVDWRADGSLAEQELGFVPRYTLEQTLEWMMEKKCSK